MIDRDIVIAKIDSIQRCLNRIEEVTGSNPQSLEDLDTQEITILNIQRAVQAAVDLASHIISEEGWGIPKELREHFDILQQRKIIDKKLAARLRNMVGFRNIAVHEYQKIDNEILKSILEYRLDDLEQFYKKIVEHYRLT